MSQEELRSSMTVKCCVIAGINLDIEKDTPLVDGGLVYGEG
jgi:hypothetical protein